MHFPQTIDRVAAHALLQTANAIMTVEGTVPLEALEVATLEAVAEEVCGRPLSDFALGVAIPDALESVVSERPEAFGDAAVTLWCMLSMVGGELRADKIEVARAAAERVGRPRAIFADLMALCRNHGARWPRYRLFRRVFRDIFHTGLVAGTLRSLQSYLGLFGGASKRRYRALAELDADTVGGLLYRFYLHNDVPLPGEFKSFPAALVGAHDVRHVLAGFDASYDGEIGIAAFEAGAGDLPVTDFMCTLMLQGHLGIEIDPTVPAEVGKFEPRSFLRELRRGNAVRADICSADWNYWPLLELPLEEARRQLGIEPGGNVEVGHSRVMAESERAA